MFDNAGDLVEGSVTVEFSSGAGTAEVTFEPTTFNGAATFSGGFGAAGMAVDANGLFGGALSGSVAEGPENFDVTGTLDAAFVEGSQSIGQVADGVITNASDPSETDAFGLIFYAD